MFLVVAVCGMVLIDTWWNVNKIFGDKWNAVRLVLIDTWWNVNLLYSLIAFIAFSVLIDTWWNVNVRDEIIFDFENQF